MFSCLRSKPFGTNVHAARALSTTPRLLFDVGSSVPAGLQGIHENSPGNPVDIGKELSKGSFIVVGLPAAFSPACSVTHVPGYIKHLDQFKAKGISQILVTTVNDSFVTKAWADQLKCPTDVRILADTRGEFAKAAGHVLDGEIIFGNKRSTRYAAIVKDGKVTKEFVEPDKIGVTVSSAESVLKAL